MQRTTIHFVEVGEQRISPLDAIEALTGATQDPWFRDKDDALAYAMRLVTPEEVRIVGFDIARHKRETRLVRKVLVPRPGSRGYDVVQVEDE
jgi:hypothetical protein